MGNNSTTTAMAKPTSYKYHIRPCGIPANSAYSLWFLESCRKHIPTYARLVSCHYTLDVHHLFAECFRTTATPTILRCIRCFDHYTVVVHPFALKNKITYIYTYCLPIQLCLRVLLLCFVSYIKSTVSKLFLRSGLVTLGSKLPLNTRKLAYVYLVLQSCFFYIDNIDDIIRKMYNV